MIPLRQSTAGQEIPLGYFLDSSDGDSEETGLTIANTDIKLWKFGATTLANKNSGGATHISNGIYYAVLDATDTDTVGALTVFIHVSGALATRVQCQVFEEAIYDALYAASANAFTGAAGSSQLSDIADNVIDTGVIATGAITAAKIAADAIGASELAADAVTEIQSGLATAAKLLAYVQLLTRSDAAIAADNSTELSEINADGGSGAGDYASTADSLEASQDDIEALNDLSTSDIDARLAAIGLDHLVSASVAGTDITDDSIIAQLVSASATADWDDYDNTTDSLEALQAEHDATQAFIDGILPKKNTALANFEFLMTDSTNHDPAAGLTVVAQRSIDGAAFGACANSVSEVSNGVYVIDLDASDLNGDVITLKFTASGADQTTITIVTQS